jgi:hypothetical protein
MIVVSYTIYNNTRYLKQAVCFLMHPKVAILEINHVE